MTKVMRGVVHGRTIELDGDTGLADGRKVELVVRAKELPGPPPGWTPEGTDTAAGMMAACWTEEDERILQAIYQERKRDRPRELPE